MFKVFSDIGKDGVSEQELTEAKLRAVGSMVMAIQTIEQQAGFRLESILNGFPADYWDRYPEQISAVAARQLAQVAGKYLQPSPVHGSRGRPGGCGEGPAREARTGEGCTDARPSDPAMRNEHGLLRPCSSLSTRHSSLVTLYFTAHSTAFLTMVRIFGSKNTGSVSCPGWK